MFKFKTLWCPVGVQHDWQACVYAHNYQDARRQVSIGYGPRPCPYWAKKDASAEYAQRCPLGLRCPFSHGAKEQLYHPQYFRTVICRDLRAKACPRMKLCAFFHRRAERRKPPADSTDYSMPLPEESLPKDWVSDFLSPPFRDATSPGTEEEAGGAAANFMGPEEASVATLGNSEAMNLGNSHAFWATYAAMAELNPYMSKQLGAGHDDFTQFDVPLTVPELRQTLAATTLITDARSTEWEASTASTRTRTLTGGESIPSSIPSIIADDSATTTSSTFRPVDVAASPPWTPWSSTLSVVAAIGSERTTKVERERPETQDWTPWKVEVPSYGPFGGPFDGFPGLIANIVTSSEGLKEGDPDVARLGCGGGSREVGGARGGFRPASGLFGFSGLSPGPATNGLLSRVSIGPGAGQPLEEE